MNEIGVFGESDPHVELADDVFVDRDPRRGMGSSERWVLAHERLLSHAQRDIEHGAILCRDIGVDLPADEVRAIDVEIEGRVGDRERDERRVPCRGALGRFRASGSERFQSTLRER